MELHFVEEGTGPLVVMLHGFPESWYSWRKQIPVIASAGFRVIAPDLRGYNESTRPLDVDAYKLSEVVGDIAGLIVQNGGRATVVGHDWGGYAAWYLAMMHPGLVERLIVLNAPHPKAVAREAHRSLEQKLRLSYQLFFNIPLLSDAVVRLLLPALAHRMGKFTDAEIDEYRKVWRQPHAIWAMLAYYRALFRHREELRTLMSRIDTPTLFIFGEHDPVFALATLDGWEKDVPNLRIERIASAGHFVQTDAPELVNRLILECLATLPTARRPTT
ncbi:MAG TPA: alpha/beta hydrolase [Thermoanaerobaculia bacterium]|nr:alpha/beta hydrolase [Thermoanaerobaculia bacterium]